MATLSPPVHPTRPTYGGGKGPRDRFPGGGGGGGGGDDSRRDYYQQLRRYRLGVALALVAVFILFLTSSAIFVMRQVMGSWDIPTQSYVHNWQPIPLPVGLLAINTLVILLSSFTLERARRQAFQRAAVAGVAGIPGIRVHGDRHWPWLGTTLALGFLFILGQSIAWRQIMGRGFYVNDNPNSSFFYVVTGMHAAHLLVGILALLYAAVFIGWGLKNLERMRLALDVTAWYWHSMGLLWLFIFALLKIVH